MYQDIKRCMHVCMYVCMYVCMHIMYVCMYIYISVQNFSFSSTCSFNVPESTVTHPTPPPRCNNKKRTKMKRRLCVPARIPFRNTECFSISLCNPLSNANKILYLSIGGVASFNTRKIHQDHVILVVIVVKQLWFPTLNS